MTGRQAGSEEAAGAPWWVAAIPLLAVVVLLLFDGALSEQLSALRSPMSDDVLQPFWVLGAWSAPVVAAILLLGLRLLFDESRLAPLASRLVAGGLLSYGFVWLLGRAVATTSAALGAGAWLESMSGAFPSPQAAVAFAFAGAIAAGGGRMLTTAALLLASVTIVERGLGGSTRSPHSSPARGRAGRSAGGPRVGWFRPTPPRMARGPRPTVTRLPVPNRPWGASCWGWPSSWERCCSWSWVVWASATRTRGATPRSPTR